MSELPNGWIQMAFGEAIQIQKGKKPVGLGPKNYARSVPYINISAFETKQVDQYAPEQEVPRCEPSDTLLVWDGARAGLAGRGIGGFIGSTLTRITSDLAAPEYLYYFVHSYYGYLNTHTKGVGIPHIDPVVLAEIAFPLPPSGEQTRIVEKLEELLSDLDAGVVELKAAQKKLVQYRQSLLKAAVEGKLTAEWRAARETVRAELVEARSSIHGSTGSPRTDEYETGAQLLERILAERRARWEAKQLAKFKAQGKTPSKDWQTKYPEPVKPNITDLTELPEGWVWASLDQLTEFITSGSRGWAEFYSDTGATFIRSQNINKDWLDLSDIAFINLPRNTEGTRTRVQKLDLLLTITGANVGKAAFVDVEIADAYVSQHVALMRPVYTSLTAYLHLFLTSFAGGRGQLNKEAYGAGKPGLNLEQVSAVLVPLPGMEEAVVVMSVITNQFSAINEQEQAIEETLKQSAAQRQNILRSAFSGQLVPQDPDDEPASRLLERIRVERVECDAVKKLRGRKTKEMI